MADENKTERVQLLMTPSEVKAIDDWSFENRIRGRAEAMRRLCQIGLGLEDNGVRLLREFQKTNELIVPLMETLTTFLNERNPGNGKTFGDVLTRLTDGLQHHRESLAEVVLTAGTIKTMRWDEPATFRSALEIVKEVMMESVEERRKASENKE